MFIKNTHILLALFLLLTGSKPVEKIDHREFLPSKEMLENSLLRYYKRIFSTIIKEKRAEDKWLILKLLPILGFNFITKTPTLAYDSRPITKSAEKLGTSAANSLSRANHLRVEFQNDIAEVYKDYDNLIEDIELYNHAVEIYHQYEKILEIKEAQYKKLEISPMEYINQTIKIKEQEISIRNSLAKIQKTKNALLEKAKVNTHGFVNKF
jgi:hypothetical protein